MSPEERNSLRVVFYGEEFIFSMSLFGNFGNLTLNEAYVIMRLLQKGNYLWKNFTNL